MNRRLRLAPAALIATCALVAVACGQKAGVHVASGGVTRNAAGQTVDASGNVIDNGTGGTGAGTATGGSPSGGTSGGTSTGGATSSGSTSGGSTSGGGGGAAAGGAANRTGVTDTEIVIAIHAPATGAGAPAPSFNAGKDVYFNFAGPVNGRKVRVVFADDGYNPGQAVSACKKLVQVDHVFMLLGGGGTDQIVACAQYAASVGVPYMAEGVTEQGLSKLPSYFALAMSYKQQGTLLAQYIKNVLHKTKVAMVRGNTANFEDAHSGFVQAAQAAGLTMVKDLSINKDASPAEATNAAQQVCTSVAPGTSPDLVVYPLMSPKVFIQFAGAASQQQCFPRYAGVGVTLGLNVVAQALCPTNAFKTGASCFSPAQGLDATDPDYVPAYKKQNGASSDPDDIGYLLWGADKLIYSMFKAAGRDLSRQSLVAAVNGHQFSTGVYPTVNYARGPFGGTAVQVLLANCGKNKYDTQFQNRASF